MTIVKDIEVSFNELSDLFSERIAGLLDSEQEESFHKTFHAFVDLIENNYGHTINDEVMYTKIKEQIPGITPYWELIKELRRHDPAMFDTLDVDYQTTMQAVINLVNSKETAQYLNVKGASYKDDPYVLASFDDATKNVKVLRLAHFVAYAASGKGSALIKDISASVLSDADKYEKIYKSFKTSVEYLRIGKEITKHKLNGASRQPMGFITDGLVLNSTGDHAHMVFATANNNFTSQGRQIFDYIVKTQERKATSLDASIRDIQTITPVMVGGALIEIGDPKPLGRIFKASTFTPPEVELINSVQFLSLLQNVDNSRTPEFLDVMMNTMYLTAGGGSSRSMHTRMAELATTPAPQRYKIMLQACAKRLAAVTTVLSQKVSEQKVSHLNNKNLNPDMHSLMVGLTSAINGLITHSAYFKNEPGADEFIEGVASTLSNANKSLQKFTTKLNIGVIEPYQNYTNLCDAIDKVEVGKFKSKVMAQPIHQLVVSTASIDRGLVMRELTEHIATFIDPCIEKEYKANVNHRKRINALEHFTRILDVKIEEGEHAKFTAEALGSTYAFIQRHLNPHSKSYDGDRLEINQAMMPLYQVLNTNHSTEDIVEGIKEIVGSHKVEHEDVSILEM